MRRDFKGSVYWDEFAETCSNTSRAVGFRGVAGFQENMVSAIGRRGVRLFEVHCIYSKASPSPVWVTSTAEKGGLIFRRVR